MKRLLLPCISVLALLAAGCGGGSAADEASRPRVPPLPTAQEIDWFRTMAAFANAVSNLSEQAAKPGSAKALAALRDCGPIFRSSVGEAPTSRQRAAARIVLGACSALRRGDLAAGGRKLSASSTRIFLQIGRAHV